MKYFSLKKASLPAGLLLLPVVTMAQGAIIDQGGELTGFLGSILAFSNDVLIPFILGIGFLVFVWGMFQYFIAGGANDEAKEKGKSLMVYATLGFVLVIVFWGVVNLLTEGTGLQQDNIGNIPSGPTL